LSVYRLSSPYERAPLQRRASGLALAVAVNIALLLALLTLGKLAPDARKFSTATVVDLLPESHSAEDSTKATKAENKAVARASRPLIKPPPIVLPAKPTISQPRPEKPLPIIEVSKEEMAAGDIGTMPKASANAEGGSGGDSEIVGKGPHGEVLYAAEWARHPTDAELGGYLPRNAQDGFGLVACKTIPGDRVEDCVELDQTPGSHLASAVRQAAWQFRVRPPRRNGVVLVGSWVSIRIDYTFDRTDSRGL
jgi:protein TonB